MTGGSFGYLFKQGMSSVWLNKVMSLASIAILTACLILLGGAGLLVVNVRDIFNEIESQNEMVVFIKDGATQTEIDALGATLKSIEHVETVTFIPREEGLEIMRDYLGEDGHLMDGLIDDNPLPDAYSLKLDDLNYLDEVQGKVLALSAVDSVKAPTELADTLTGLEKTLGILGLVLIGILLIASLIVIGNTIKLTVFSRRKEINIMRYVGATNRFIRFPFVVEGLTLGFIAAIIAFAVIFFVYQSFDDMLAGTSIGWLQSAQGSVIPFWDIWYWVLGGFLASGMLVGAIGSSSATSKHLKV